MTEYPYILFNKSPEQMRQLGACGGRAYGRNQRARRALVATPPEALPPLRCPACGLSLPDQWTGSSLSLWDASDDPQGDRQIVQLEIGTQEGDHPVGAGLAGILGHVDTRFAQRSLCADHWRWLIIEVVVAVRALLVAAGEQEDIRPFFA
jgi:hypothetical protein